MHRAATCWRRPTKFWRPRARPSSTRCSAVRRSVQPVAVRKYLSAKLADFEHEVFAVLFLDTQHRLIEYSELFRGTIDSASVYPRELVKEALRLNAAAVIVSHNHPSGADKVLTQRLREALALVDVRTLDHIIVAGGSTISFAERGLI